MFFVVFDYWQGHICMHLGTSETCWSGSPTAQALYYYFRNNYVNIPFPRDPAEPAQRCPNQQGDRLPSDIRLFACQTRKLSEFRSDTFFFNFLLSKSQISGISIYLNTYDIPVIQRLTSCHKNCMTTRYTTLGYWLGYWRLTSRHRP